MPEGIELIGLLATRCFCVVQNQKGVADAMIEAEKYNIFLGPCKYNLSIRPIRFQLPEFRAASRESPPIPAVGGCLPVALTRV